MNARTQITLDPEQQRRAQKKAADLGISFAEYVRRLVSRDLDDSWPSGDISTIFDLIKDGPPTNIARDKDRMIGEAVWAEHVRSIGRRARDPKPRRR
jgi:hypothetical protein